MTETALADLLVGDLSSLDLVALMIDGVYFAEHLCVVALGIDIDGIKHPMGLVEGRPRTQPRSRPCWPGCATAAWTPASRFLAVLDGAKALAAGVNEVFDSPVLARCQLHKLRNVRDHLPENMRAPVEKRIRKAYHTGSALEAEAQLTALAKEFDKTHGDVGLTLADLAEAKSVGEVLNVEFNTSPRGGGGGNRTRVR